MPSYPQQPASKTKVAGVVMFYMVSALVMIFVNKAVLNSSPELPFTFLFIQMIIAVFLLHVLAAVVPKSSSFKSEVALPDLSADIAYKLMPVISVGVIALVFNTLCLRNVDASFFQIARGLLLPFTILVASIQARLIPRSNVLRAACLVTLGFFVGISPSSFFRSSDMSITAEGDIIPGGAENGTKAVVGGLDTDKVLALIYGSLSAFMTALHAVMVKNAVKTMDGSILKLTYWNNFMSSFFLFPCIILNGEAALFIRKFVIPFTSSLSALPSTAPTPLLAALAIERNTFITGSLVTGFFGFLLGLAGLLSIKVTSPVTHMVTSATRSVLQTFLGVLLFGEIVTGRRAMSIGVITMGAVYYTWIQSSSPPPPSMVATMREDDSASAKAEAAAWARGHGTTHSLATLLPLHAPKAIRAIPVDAVRNHRRLGSISEEEELSYHEEYHDASPRASSTRSNSWGEGLNEKGDLLPEDDMMALGRSRSPGALNEKVRA